MRKYYIILILLLSSIGIARSQEIRKEIRVDFRVNVTSIDAKFSDNEARMKEIVSFLKNVTQDSTITILEVSFCGAASPEGSYQLNRKLARGRLTSLEKIVRKEVYIPDSLITRNDSYIPWEYLIEQIKNSDISRKDEVLAILEGEGQLVDYHHPNTHVDDRIVKLKKLDNGRVWQQLHRFFFEDMRNASVVFIIYKKMLPVVEEPQVVPDTVVPEPLPVEVDTVPAPEEPEEDAWVPRLHLKTNMVGLGFGVVNGAVELDFAKHWSFALPVYYSAWNYFSETLKFRTFSVYPELRYWQREDNSGLFAGVHFGLAYFNYAFNGDYRYQDHDRQTPAIGGGLSVGYRLPLSKNRKWNVEFVLGAGCYDIKYDRFYNVNNGRMVDTVSDVYFNIDQAAITFSYAFDLKKKGGKR